jgi:hypothetical protein
MTRQLLRRKLEKMHGKRLIKNSKNSRNSWKLWRMKSQNIPNKRRQ